MKGEGCEEGEREPGRGHKRNPNSVKIRNGTKQSLEPWTYPQLPGASVRNPTHDKVMRKEALQNARM